MKDRLAELVYEGYNSPPESNVNAHPPHYHHGQGRDQMNQHQWH